MEIELQVIEVLERIGIRGGQAVLDFGCGIGAYTIPVAELVGQWGRVYALDKDDEALDKLTQQAEADGLKNIKIIETSGELEIGLSDESVDAVLLFDVFHSFYFPQAGDRIRLLGEIHRIMKPFAFLYISVWPNLIEPGTEDEIKNANFRKGKEVSEEFTYGNKEVGMRRILSFTKGRSSPVIDVSGQLRVRKEII